MFLRKENAEIYNIFFENQMVLSIKTDFLSSAHWQVLAHICPSSYPGTP
jgi:hypothetical protein